MDKRYLIVAPILSVLVGIAFIFGCGKKKPTESENHAPVVKSVTANPSSVAPGDSSTVTAVATDEDGNDLTYTWDATDGTFPSGATGASVLWVAPNEAGVETVTVTVNDGKATDSEEVPITISITTGTVKGYVYEAQKSVSPGKNRIIDTKKVILKSKVSKVEYGEISFSPKSSKLSTPIKGAIVSIGSSTDTTNSSGYYKLEEIPTGQQTILATKSDYENYSDTLTVTTGTTTHDIYMTPETVNTANVSGYIYYSGTTISVAGVLVSIDTITYTTGSNGYYELNDVPTGQQTITTTKTNYDDYSQSIEIPDTGLIHDIEMTSDIYTHKVYGTAANALSQTLSNVKVIVLNPDSSESQLWTTTSATGYYQVPAVPQGNRVVRFIPDTLYDTLGVGIFIANADYQYDARLVSFPIEHPTGLFAEAHANYDRRIILSWNKRNEPTLKGYHLYRSFSSDTGYTQIGSLFSPPTEIHTDSSLLSTTYYYKIASVNIDNIEDTLSAYTFATTLDSFGIVDSFNTGGAPLGLAWDGSNLWSCDKSANKIYKHNANMDVIETYDNPGSYPSGLTWDGSNLWSCDLDTDKIYKHDANMNVDTSYEVPGNSFDGVCGLTWDGYNMWSCNTWTDKIYKYDANMSVIATYNSPEIIPSGLTWDSYNMWSCDLYVDKLYKHDDNMNPIATYDSPGSRPTGLTWDGFYLWSCDKDTEKIYKHLP